MPSAVGGSPSVAAAPGVVDEEEEVEPAAPGAPDDSESFVPSGPPLDGVEMRSPDGVDVDSPNDNVVEFSPPMPTVSFPTVPFVASVVFEAAPGAAVVSSVGPPGDIPGGDTPGGPAKHCALRPQTSFGTGVVSCCRIRFWPINVPPLVYQCHVHNSCQLSGHFENQNGTLLQIDSNGPLRGDTKRELKVKRSRNR